MVDRRATTNVGTKVKPTGKYHHGALREALIKAGLEILRERGLDALSLRACAERIGVSHAAPAHHFRTGKALVTAIATQGFDALTKDLSAARQATGPDPFDQLKAAYAAYLRFVLREPDLFKLMFSMDRLDPQDAAIQESSAKAYQRLTEAAMPLHARVTAKAGYDQMRTEQLLWAVLQGYAKLYLNGNIACTLEDDHALVAEAQRFADLLQLAGSTPGAT